MIGGYQRPVAEAHQPDRRLFFRQLVFDGGRRVALEEELQAAHHQRGCLLPIDRPVGREHDRAGALDKPFLVEGPHGACEPIRLVHVEERLTGRLRQPECPGQEHGHLRPSHRFIRTERAVLAPLHDSLPGQSAHGLRVPLVPLDVGEGLGHRGGLRVRRGLSPRGRRESGQHSDGKDGPGGERHQRANGYRP